MFEDVGEAAVCSEQAVGRRCRIRRWETHVRLGRSQLSICAYWVHSKFRYVFIG